MSFIGTLINGGGSNVVTPDLLKDTSKPITDTDYFDIVITDLQPNTSYNVQFSWIYPDDARSDYSATYTFSTDPETAPAIPSQPTVSAGPGLINVTWNGNKASGGALQNYAKVNIYVDGVLKDFFLAAGTKSIPLAKGTYAVTLRSASSTNVVSNATSPAVSVTVTSDSTDATAALSGLDNKISISASSIVNPTTKQLTAIDTAGITVYSGASSTSGARVVMNSLGIAAYNSSNVATFSIEATSGNAFFKGEIQSSSGTIGGWTIGSEKLSSSQIELVSTDTSLGYGYIKFNSGAQNYTLNAFLGIFSIDNNTFGGLITARTDGIMGFAEPSGYLVQNFNSSLNNKQLRNIYVSSTAGEPSPSSPQTGDIKLEW
jgi:hypothetical protein